MADPDGRMAWLVIVATVPAALFGYFFEGFFETTARSPWVVALCFILNGGFLLACEAITRRNRQAYKLSFPEALGVGAAQAIGLLPGVSRSGATMAMGIGLNLRREEAARFSFLMSIPTIIGAGLIQLEEAASEVINLSGALLFGVGLVTSAVVAYITIKLFLSFVVDHNLRIFAYYSFGLAAVAIVALLLL
jgi:undecaprenyl-diphosphatase